MSSILKIDVSSIETYQNSFETEFNNFKNNAYNTFNSSYLSTCSDSVVKSMYWNLNKKYTKIDRGYNKINKWWISYLSNVVNLENFLAGNSNGSGIDDPEVISAIGYLLDLQGYENNIEGIFSKISDGEYSNVFSFDNSAENVDLTSEFGNSEYNKSLLATGAKLIASIEATKSSVGLSLIEGLGQFGEALVDFGVIGLTVKTSISTLGADALNAIYGLITGNKYESVTKQMWNDTKAFVAKKHVTDWFDNLYENTDIGKLIKKYSYGFDTIRSVGNGIGYGTGVVAFTILTFGVGGAVAGGSAVTSTTIASAASASNLAITAAAAGTGKYTQNAWADGAGILKGLGAGMAKGAWDGIQYYIGGKINNFNLIDVGGKFLKETGINILDKVINIGARALLDGADSGLDSFVNPTIDAIFKEGYKDTNGKYVEFSDNDSFGTKWQKLFEENGGVSGVFTNALIGAGLSFLSEIPSLFKKSNSPKGKVIDNKKYSEYDTIDVDGKIIGDDYDVLDDEFIKRPYSSKKGTKPLSFSKDANPKNKSRLKINKPVLYTPSVDSADKSFTRIVFEETSDLTYGFGNDQGHLRNLQYYVDDFGNRIELGSKEYINAIKSGKNLTLQQTGDLGCVYNLLTTKYKMSFEDAVRTAELIDVDEGVCSYAATLDNLAMLFIDKQQEFYDKTGIPLFVKGESKSGARMNTAELLADLYVTINSVKNGGSYFATTKDGRTVLTEAIEFDQFGNAFKAENASQVFLSYADSGSQINVINKYLRDNGLSNINLNFWSSIDDVLHSEISREQQENMLDVIKQGIKKGKQYQMGIYKNLFDDLIPDDGVRFINKYGDIIENSNNWDAGGHEVKIIGMNDNNVVVSTWGMELFIPYKDLLDSLGRWNISEIFLEQKDRWFKFLWNK